MEKKGKLELTWVGKYEEEKLEPRILIEDKSKSYGDSNTENMLIHGDNLLALMALQSEFSGKVKCIYIDPPYNTGNAFEYYDWNRTFYMAFDDEKAFRVITKITERGWLYICSN